MDGPFEAVMRAQAEARAERQQQQVRAELRNALARSVKRADAEGWLAPVVTLRATGRPDVPSSGQAAPRLPGSQR